MRTYLSVFLGFLLACGSTPTPTPAQEPELTPSIDDGPTITTGPKLQVIVGVEGGSLGTGSIDGAPGIADFRRITGLFRGPYDGPGAYDGREEIETALVIDSDPTGGRHALRAVDRNGNVTTLARRSQGFEGLFAVNGAVVVPTEIPDGKGATELHRIGLDGSDTLLGTVPFPVVHGAFDGTSYVLASRVTLYRWTPGSAPVVVVADARDSRVGEVGQEFREVTLDRATGTVYALVSAAEIEGDRFQFATRVDGGSLTPLPQPIERDLRIVRGEVRGQLRGDYSTVLSPTLRLPGEDAWYFGGAARFTLGRATDTIGVSDYRLVHFTKPDRSDETLFAGREFTKSDLPFDECRLSESARQTPWIACTNGVAPVHLAAKSVGTLAPTPVPTIWIDVDPDGSVQTLQRDGTRTKDGTTSLPGFDVTLNTATRTKKGLWAVNRFDSYFARDDGRFLVIGGGAGHKYGSIAALDEEPIAAYASGLYWFASPTSRTENLRSGTVYEAEIRGVRRFNNSLYVATLSTIERVDLRTHETTVVLGTLGKHAFVSDGSGLPFIDDFTFDHQGGVVIYSAATRSIYYARP